jgi:hypothetical protein
MLIQWMELPRTFNASLAEFLEKRAKPEAQKKRKHPRLKAKNLMKYGDYPEPTEWHTSNLLDLSEGGIKFVSETRLVLGSLLEITILVDGDNRQIPVIGKVAWVRNRERRSFYIGVSLTEIKQEDRELIRKLAQSQKI